MIRLLTVIIAVLTIIGITLALAGCHASQPLNVTLRVDEETITPTGLTTVWVNSSNT